MDILSENPSSVREVLFALEGEISDGTVRSILHEMRDKGLAKRGAKGRWCLIQDDLSDAA